MLTLILLNLNRIEFGKINLIDNRYGHLEEFLNSEICIFSGGFASK